MLETLTIDQRIKFRDPKELLSMPKTIRVNHFNEDAVKNFSNGMSMAHHTGQPIIPIIIDTEGGDPYSLLAMVDMIEMSKVPVATIIAGKAFSCGAVLFCCGSDGYRFMGPNSTLMIHDVLSGDENFKKTKEVMSDAMECSRLNKRLYKTIDKGIGKPIGYTYAMVQKRSRTDWYLNAYQAQKLGYANHVRVPTFKCSVKVEMELI